MTREELESRVIFGNEMEYKGKYIKLEDVVEYIGGVEKAMCDMVKGN